MGYGGQAENLFIVQRDYVHRESSGGRARTDREASSRRPLVGWFGNDLQRSTGMVFSVQMTSDAVEEENEGSGGSYSPR
jgi:hypothetical protein